MKVVGIDPGTQRVGFAVLEVGLKEKPRILDLGVWDLIRALKKSSDRPAMAERLELLYENSAALFEKWNPTIIGLEKAVVFKNPASSLALSEARGVIRLASQKVLAESHKRWIEMSPTQAKRMSSGFGQSKKLDLKRILGLRFQESVNEFFRDENILIDAFDAVAIAWTAWVLRKSPSARPLREVNI